MNLSQFFEHWRIVENPFRGEEARHDAVFARIGLKGPGPAEAAPAAGPTVVAPSAAGGGGGAGGGGPSANGSALVDGQAVFVPPAPSAPPRVTPPPAFAPFHSDFEKILGDPARPSTAIVFGEKGSGKTAIRLQLADRVAEHNARQPQARVLLVPYDDLNGVLDRFTRRSGAKTTLEALQRFRLADHLDAMLALVVPRVIDAILSKAADPNSVGPPVRDALDLGPEPRKLARRLDDATKRDLLLLQAAYDRPDGAEGRTARLRRVLRVGLPGSVLLWKTLVAVGWVPAAAVAAWHLLEPGDHLVWNLRTYTAAGLFGLWLVALAKRLLWDRLGVLRVAHRVRRQVRVQGRSDRSYAASLEQLDPRMWETPGALPTADSDEPRYAMLARLQRVLRPFGYVGLMVVIDRVDEPTLVAGDPEKMRAIVWPMLSNKFLQAEGLGVKMLLPIELRHALFKESGAFFQEARLDKQHLVERLSWTGPMLYDLCDARLKACRSREAGPISLMDLFAPDVTPKDVIDALDQMHQPRDAFKFLYAVLGEHCSNVTGEQGASDPLAYKVPRATLEFVRKAQSDRVQQLYRGIRPA